MARIVLMLWALLGSQICIAKLKEARVCGKRFWVEIARSEAEKQKGLMNRESIDRSYAMIFVYNKNQKLNFWMKNVPFDLRILFFDKSLKLVDQQLMKGTSPVQMESSLPTYQSKLPATYAVEVHPEAISAAQLTGACRLNFKGI